MDIFSWITLIALVELQTQGSKKRGGNPQAPKYSSKVTIYYFNYFCILFS